MRKVLLVISCLFVIQGLIAQDKEGGIVDPKDWMKKIVWDSPKRTKIQTLDTFYDRGDIFHKHIMDIGNELVFYDVRMIANSDTGDTIVAVVDEEGNIRSRYLAMKQYLSSIELFATLIIDGKKLVHDGLDIRKNIKQIIKLGNSDDFIRTLSISSSTIKAFKQLKNMYSVVINDAQKGFEMQRDKIRRYIKQADVVTDLSDPSLRNIPGVVLDGTAVLTKTDQEIMDGIGQSETVDMEMKNDMDILEELEKLD